MMLNCHPGTGNVTDGVLGAAGVAENVVGKK